MSKIEQAMEFARKNPGKFYRYGLDPDDLRQDFFVAVLASGEETKGTPERYFNFILACTAKNLLRYTSFRASKNDPDGEEKMLSVGVFENIDFINVKIDAEEFFKGTRYEKRIKDVFEKVDFPRGQVEREKVLRQIRQTI